jgi:hypothetical protein
MKKKCGSVGEQGTKQPNTLFIIVGMRYAIAGDE